MAPRFMERLQRQSDVLKELYGMPRFDPPPYTRLSCHTSSSASIFSSSDSSSGSSSPSEASTAASSVDLGHTFLPSYQQATQHVKYRETPCIARGSRILVTGANSWLGMHIVKQLLQQGYRVRGTARVASKASRLTAYFHARSPADFFEATVVADMGVPGAYDLAMRGCSGVIHAAGIRNSSGNPYDVIPQTIMGALNVLEAASREPRLQRVVYCGSVLAAKDQSTTRPSTVTSDSWNMAAFRIAWSDPPYKPDRAQSVLASAALQTEQTMRKWYRDRRPSFVLNCVLSDKLTGEQLLPEHAENHTVMSLQADPLHHCTDVEDLALVHVAALILPGVMNERLFAVAQPIDPLALAYLTGNRNQVTDEIDQTHYKEAPRAEELLIRMRKYGWTLFETSVRRTHEFLSDG